MNVTKQKTSHVFQNRLKPIITSELHVDLLMHLTKDRKEINLIFQYFLEDWIQKILTVVTGQFYESNTILRACFKTGNEMFPFTNIN